MKRFVTVCNRFKGFIYTLDGLDSMTKTTTKKTATKKTVESKEDIVKEAKDAFESISKKEIGMKKTRRYMKKPTSITLDDIKSDEKMLELARQIVEESRRDLPTNNKRVALEVFNIEPETLHTARAFVSKLNISFTAVYNLMDELQREGRIRVIVADNRRKYFTSISNTNTEFVV